MKDKISIQGKDGNYIVEVRVEIKALDVWDVLQEAAKILTRAVIRQKYQD